MRFAKRSDDTLVAHLRIIVLVQEGTQHIVDELVLEVEHIDRPTSAPASTGAALIPSPTNITVPWEIAVA